MRLTLNHTQRLNLRALLDAQRADLGSIRASWAIEDRMALDGAEEKPLELKRDIMASQERVVWSPALCLTPKEYEFTDVEIARIKTALQTWD